MISMRTAARWKFVLLGILAASCGPGELQTGIDGTGAHTYRDVVSYGRNLTPTGLLVNGVSYDVSGATILINGSPATPSDINPGDVVFVEGRIELPGNRAIADRIVADHAVQGVIESMSATEGWLMALGQTVKVDSQTAFGTPVVNGLAGLAAGQAISVSGFRTVYGDIVATRIELQAGPTPGSRTTGPVSSLATSDQLLGINDLLVDYSNVSLAPADLTALQNGAFAEVAGEIQAATGRMVASSVAVRRQRMPGTVNSSAQLEGFVTALNAGEQSGFHIDGLPVATNDATAQEGVLTVEARVQVAGSVNSSGTVVASTVQGGAAPSPPGSGSPPPPPGVPTPPVADLRITGRVFDALSGPVANASVDAWIQTERFGYAHTWATGASPRTGADGSFEFFAPSGSLLQIYIYKEGYVQPCAVWVDANPALPLEVEVVALSTLDSSNPPPPQSATGALTVTGTVFETVGGSRVPVAGATIWAGDSMGLNYANTVTDREGRYLVCRLPGNDSRWRFSSELWVQKPGFNDHLVWSIDTSQSQVVDIDLVRKP
jgi:hypothetical protein